VGFIDGMSLFSGGIQYHKVQFYPDHIKILGDSMLNYFSILIQGIQEKTIKK